MEVGVEWSLALLWAAVVRGEVWLRENILMALSEVNRDEGVRREARENGTLRLAGFGFFPIACYVHVHKNAISIGSPALKLYTHPIYNMMHIQWNPNTIGQKKVS